MLMRMRKTPLNRQTAQAWSRSEFFHFGRGEHGGYHFASSSMPQNVKLIGKGQIGGKARGLLFVIDHLAKGGKLSAHDDLIRFPDSLILGTDVFDEFMAANSLNEAVLARCNEKLGGTSLEELFASAQFPSAARDALAQALKNEHRPLVVRSSSLMEDNAEHSFAGIYLSDFLSNTGGDQARLERLIATIKRVYASTFGQNARAYRKRHGLPWREEKMAILIQNMIGQHYQGNLFYPLIGGVGFSLNFYPWSDRLRSEDGVARLVVGVGTRAVGREYARVFSPKFPGLRPEGSDERAIIQYSQETVDVLDMETGGLSQTRLPLLDNPLLREVCSVVDSEGVLSEPVSALPPGGRYIASFDRFIGKTNIMPFTPLLRELLAGLQQLFERPIDIEFAVNFPTANNNSGPLFYLLQARPLGGRSQHRRIRVPAVSQSEMLLSSQRVLGNGMRRKIHDLIFVDPSTYRWENAHTIARQVGKIDQDLDGKEYVLIGPGRWGTSNPQLGVPVQYGEIAGASVIVEMATESFSPELSYGTHFYADMVASGVLYLPLNESGGDYFSRELLNQQETVYSDAFVRHVHFQEGLDVYVDGKGKKSLICLSQRKRRLHPVNA
ncbi:hypothetical protein J7K60_00330 [Candidatus Bipolaricaulota bacterium]|nr:hypothetical protein [Candidatus Bipolaricaulota bacterium]HHR84962.1 hypothetical protein [Candidatus Acetothermia bacterium]